MSLKIKICGMTDAENMREIASLQPDLFGLIFYPKSPRFVSPGHAKALPQFDNVKRVGVFVNESLENILTIAEETNLAFVQLHGNESPEFCAELKSQSSQKPAREQGRDEIKIIKVFSVGDDASLLTRRLLLYENVCDYFLFDTKTPAHGGSGKSFDWRILQQSLISKPFFLSGGIGAENAAEAVAACDKLPLFALDVNSRAEIAPGIKSPEIIKEIIKNL